MIEINIAPVTLRRKSKKKAPFDLSNLPKEAVIGLIGGLVVLLFLVHFVLTAVLLMRYSENTKIEKQLSTIKEKWGAAKKVKQQMRVLQNKISAIEKVTTEKRISWARKLNEISDDLPRGVWLNKLSLDGKTLLIDGSSVSKDKDEMISVGTFTSNLKGDESFMRGLASVEVSSIQRRRIKAVGVADFIIKITLK